MCCYSTVAYIHESKIRLQEYFVELPCFCSRNNSEKPDDDTSLVSAYQGLPISENNSPSNDNLTENSLAGKSESEKLSHSRKGSSGSIAVPETVLSARKVDRYAN